MKRSRFSEGQIIAILKEAEAEPVKTVCARHNLSQATYYQWKSKFGGMEVEEAGWPDPGKVGVKKVEFCATKESRTNEAESV